MCLYSLSSPQLVGGEQVPHPRGAGICRAPAAPRLTAWFFVLAADRGPLPPRVRLEVERPELVHAEDDLWLGALGDDLAVGDGVQVLDPGLLDRIVRVFWMLSKFSDVER